MTTSFEQILYDVADRTATITLNRPENLNAFTPVMRDELIEAFRQADEDDEVRVIIVTGTGRCFCAGADLGKGAKTFERPQPEGAEPDSVTRDGGGRVTLAIYNVRKPVIAAINGPAVGIGATMTLAMDIRLASEKAKFGFVFTRRGIVPEACSTWFLPRIVGIETAAEWIFSGRVFPATEALERRLVSRVLPPEMLLPAAHKLAQEIVENTSAVSVALCRQMLWKMLGASHPMEAHRIESRGLAYMGASADTREGVSSFLEKRPAIFTMQPSSDMPDYYPWWDEPSFEG